jgi:K+/H+ antiporter YhaU regulatory subunit KhtT
MGSDQEISEQLPDADYRFREGDVMLVMGPEKRLKRLERAG